jgi:hypothetical protein
MVRDALPLAVEQIAPPPELGDRIMGVVSSEAELLRAAGSDADQPAKRERERRGWRSNWLSGGVIGLATGAALAAGSCSAGSHDVDSGACTSTRRRSRSLALARLIVEAPAASCRWRHPTCPRQGLRDVVLRSWRPPGDEHAVMQADGEGQVYVPTRCARATRSDHRRAGGWCDAPTSPPVSALSELHPRW